MSFASFAHSSVLPALLPLQSLWRFLLAPSFAPSTTGRPISPKRQVARSPAFLRPVAVRSELCNQPATNPVDCKRLPVQQSAATNQKILKPPCRSGSPALRVVRLLESGQSPKAVGRMVISGRMADVCAELDRLVGPEQCIPGEVVH